MVATDNFNINCAIGQVLSHKQKIAWADGLIIMNECTYRELFNNNFAGIVEYYSDTDSVKNTSWERAFNLANSTVKSIDGVYKLGCSDRCIKEIIQHYYKTMDKNGFDWRR